MNIFQLSVSSPRCPTRSPCCAESFFPFILNWNANLKTWVIYSILCAQFNHDATEREKEGASSERCKSHRALNIMLRHVSISNFLLLLSRINCTREKEWSSFSFCFLSCSTEKFSSRRDALFMNANETLSFTSKLFDFVCAIYCNEIDNDELLYADLSFLSAESFLNILHLRKTFKELYWSLLKSAIKVTLTSFRIASFEKNEEKQLDVVARCNFSL